MLKIDDVVVFRDHTATPGELAGVVMGIHGDLVIVLLDSPDRNGNKAAVYLHSVLEVKIAPAEESILNTKIHS